MSREYKNKSIVSGLSVQDVLNKQPDEFENMADSDLRKVVGRLVSAGNKRLRNFEKRGEKSPAYNAAMRSGGKFSVAGKDRKGLMNELQRARIFFKNETSSLKRWKEVKVEYTGKMGVKTPQMDENGEYMYTDFNYLDGNNDFSKAVWEMVDRLHEIDPTIVNNQNKYNAAQQIADMAIESGEPLNIRHLTQEIYNSLLEAEEEREALNHEFDESVSQFFE